MRLIDADQIHHAKYHGIAEIYPSDVNIESYKRGWNDALDAVADPSCSPTIDAIPIIRCKDCKHRPTGSGVNHDVVFPQDDFMCPCRCDDYWYSWMPDDDWFCANGERKEE